MHLRTRSPQQALALALSISIAPSSGLHTNAHAWEPGGTIVCGSPGQQYYPQIAPDGAGGAFISWTDARSGTTQRNIYLTRITSNGDRYPGWPLDGTALTGPPVDYSSSWIISDGEGGCYVGWAGTSDEPGNVDIAVYLQRVGPDGSLPPGWEFGGKRMSAPGPTAPVSVRLASDGQGGVYAAWWDASSQTYAYLQHYLGDGTIAPGWSELERRLSPSSIASGAPGVLPDGMGGVLLACADSWIEGQTRIFAQRLMSDGSTHPGWPTNGTTLVEAVGGRSPNIASDGAGGMYVVWQDRRLPYRDIYASRVRADGTIPPGWPVNGMKLCGAIEDQLVPSVVADGAGGFIAIWADLRDLWTRVYAIRVDSLGQRRPGWPENGLRVSTTPNQQLWGYALVADGFGGAYIAWTDEGTGSPGVLRVQHLTGNGTIAPGFTPEGIEIAPPGRGQDYPSAITDGMGGMIITWDDARYAEDIYAQHVGIDGVVSTQLSLVSLDATATAVRVRGHLAGSDDVVIVERREPDGPWQPQATVLSANGTIEYVDEDVLPARRYGYRLGVGFPLRYTAESWVEVPGELQLTLEGLRPNPAVGPLNVVFTLPREAPGTLELHDLAGRRLHSTDVGSLSPGRHVLALPARVAPGLYWLRLTHGGQSRVVRAVVAR